MAKKTNTKKPILSTTEKAIRILAIAVEKAANKIDSSADNAILKISKAADVASDKIASDASKATDVVANSAATALKVSNASGNSDHDLLIRLEEGLKTLGQTLTDVKKELKDDIKEIKDGTAQKIETNRQDIELIKIKMPSLLTDVEVLKFASKPTNDTLVLLEKIAGHSQLLIKIGGAWLLLITSMILFHFFGIKI